MDSEIERMPNKIFKGGYSVALMPICYFCKMESWKGGGGLSIYYKSGPRLLVLTSLDFINIAKRCAGDEVDQSQPTVLGIIHSQGSEKGRAFRKRTFVMQALRFLRFCVYGDPNG